MTIRTFWQENPNERSISLLFIAYMAWALMICVSGAVILVWQASVYIKTSRQDWQQINASLTNIVPGERTRKNVPENILMLTYDYVFNGTTYQTYYDHVIPPDQFAEDEIKKINDSKTVSIYYNRNNPEETIFGAKPVKMTMPNFIMFEFIGLFMAWGGARILVRNYKFNFGRNAPLVVRSVPQDNSEL